MKTVLEVLKLSTEFLGDRREVEEILSYVLGLKRLELYLQFDRPILEGELSQIRGVLKRCKKGEPIEYVMGEVEFFGCKLKVDRRVLIPRPETEILVGMVLKKIKRGVVWDMCTGSGCIGIALKKARPELAVTLSDISPDVLTLASENAKRNSVDVEILQGDLFAPFKGRKADVVICNPPYISQSEFAQLHPSVKDFEPKLALLAGESGLEFYERLAREWLHYLKAGGQVFFEIGSTQGDAMKRLFPEGELHSDWAGHPRFFLLPVIKRN